MLCPFHEEKTPSLLVTFSKELHEWNARKKQWEVKYIDEKFNKWKCFGCGEGGSNLYYLLDVVKRDYNEYYVENQWRNLIAENTENDVDNNDIPF